MRPLRLVSVLFHVGLLVGRSLSVGFVWQSCDAFRRAGGGLSLAGSVFLWWGVARSLNGIWKLLQLPIN